MYSPKFKLYCKEHGLSQSFEIWEENISFPKTGFYYPLNLCLDFCIIIQYSGLEDKYGKEIYFNCSILKYGKDIFMLSFSDEEYGFICPHIEWIKGGRDWSYSEFVYDKSCEIIGDIYNNPELMSND